MWITTYPPCKNCQSKWLKNKAIVWILTIMSIKVHAYTIALLTHQQGRRPASGIWSIKIHIFFLKNSLYKVMIYCKQNVKNIVLFDINIIKYLVEWYYYDIRLCRYVITIQQILKILKWKMKLVFFYCLVELMIKMEVNGKIHDWTLQHWQTGVHLRKTLKTNQSAYFITPN